MVEWLDARTGSRKCSKTEELGELYIKIHKAERLIKIGADSNKVMEKLLDDAQKIVFTEE